LARGDRTSVKRICHPQNSAEKTNLALKNSSVKHPHNSKSRRDIRSGQEIKETIDKIDLKLDCIGNGSGGEIAGQTELEKKNTLQDIQFGGNKAFNELTAVRDGDRVLGAVPAPSLTMTG
jgi:hypothetical protein